MEVVKAKGSLDDIEGIKDVVFEWRDNWNGKDFGMELDLETYFKDLGALVENEDSDLLLLMKKDRVAGYMGVVCFTSPLGNQKICEEHYWYVLAKHRGRANLPLLGAAIKWAKEKGCSHLIMNASNIASEMHNKLCKFYERIDFMKFETSYIKKLS